MEIMMMTSFAIGGLLILPTLTEWMVQQKGTVLAFSACIALAYFLAPVSPEFKAFWSPISAAPGDFSDGLSKLNASYFNAMH